MSRFNRSRLCLAFMASVLAFAPAMAQERTLVVSAFGVSQNELRKELYAPFEAKCKCKIVVNVGNSADRLAKMEARKGNPEVDVAVLADFSALEAAQKDLIEPIDVSKLKNYSKLHDFAKDPIGNHMGVGYTYFATSIVYRSDKVKIDSWKDLAKPELKGRLALPNITTTQGPTMLMMVDKAHGGTTPNLATGIQKVADIKGGVVTFYERSAQLVQLFQQEEIYAAVIGRFNWPLLKKLNLPLAWATPKEGLTGGINVLVVTNGLGFEPWAGKLIKSAGYKGHTVVAAKGVKARHMEEEQGHAAHAGHAHEELDPHAWQNPNNVVFYVRNIAAALSQVDAAGASGYQANAEAYVKELQALDVWAKAQIASIPAAKRKVITSHDAFGYFGAHYGVQFLAPQGINTETEPSAKQVAQLIRQIQREKIRAVFLENMGNPKLIAQLSKDAGATLGATLYADALSAADKPGATSYLQMARYNVTHLVAGMQLN